MEYQNQMNMIKAQLINMINSDEHTTTQMLMQTADTMGEWISQFDKESADANFNLFMNLFESAFYTKKGYIPEPPKKFDMADISPEAAAANAAGPLVFEN